MNNHKILLSAFIAILLPAISSMAQVQSGEADRLYQKGRALAYERRYLEAADSLKYAYTLDPANRRVIMLLGEIYLKMGNLPGAEQAFNQLRELDPGKPQGYVKMAELYWHWEQYDLAGEYLLTASQLSEPDDAEVYFWQGQILRSAHKLAASDSVLSEGLKYYPDYPRLLANSAATKIMLGDSARARKYLENAYNLDSGAVYVVNTMVSYMIYRNDLESARLYLERAYSLDPDDPFTRSNVSTFREASRSSAALGHFTEGNQAFGKALYRKARDCYLNALAEDSLFFEAVMNLGYAYLHLGEPENARGAFSKAARLRPDFAKAFIGWADALAGLNQIEEAIEKYARALELDSSNQELQEIYRQILKVKAERDR